MMVSPAQEKLVPWTGSKKDREETMMTQRENPAANHQILGLVLLWTQYGFLAAVRDGSVTEPGVGSGRKVG